MCDKKCEKLGGIISLKLLQLLALFSSVVENILREPKRSLGLHSLDSAEVKIG